MQVWIARLASENGHCERNLLPILEST